MRYNTISKYFYSCFLSLEIGCLLCFSVDAQQSSTLYLMHSLPQANYLNPAVQIPCKVFVGFPLLSSVHVNYSNTFFSYNDVISSGSDGLVHFNPNYFLKSAGSKQQISVELFETLLNFGFLYHDYYFNFNIEDKIDAAVNYPVNVISLALRGNTPFVGEKYDLSGLKVSATYYREWAFGVSKVIDNQLTLGVKAKLLFGKASVRSPQSDVFLSTSDPKFYLTASSNLQLNASPIDITISDHGRVTSAKLPAGTTPVSFLLNRQNKGGAVDFGAIYKYNSKITLMASLLDLGLIYWQTNPIQIKEKSEFEFNGITFNPVTNTIDNINQLRDDYRNNLKFTSAVKPYFAAISPKLYMAGTYDIFTKVNAGLTIRNQLNYGKLLSSATASVNAQYKKYLAGSLSWSYINGSFMNFGAGLSMRTPNFGFYAISDNVYGAFKYKSARLINLRFGFNFLFGCSTCNKKANVNATGCAVYRDEQMHDERMKRLKEKLKKQSK